MDDPTRHSPALQPSLADDLRDLDTYGEAFLDEVTHRIGVLERLPEHRQWEVSFGDEFEARVLDRAFPERITAARRGLKALALAPTLHVYWALVNGERVPWNTLSYFTAQRYGLKLRRRNSEGRYCLDDFNDVPKPGR